MVVAPGFTVWPVGATASEKSEAEPVKATTWGLLGALSLKVSVALRAAGDDDAGLKLIVMVHELPWATLEPQGLLGDKVKSDD